MKARVLHPDLAPLERGVLHLRRKGLRNRVAKDAKTDWRIDITRCFAPIFEIGERVTLCRILFLHLIRIGRTMSRLVRPGFHSAPSCEINRSNRFTTRSLPITSSM